MISGFALYEIILDEGGNPCDYRFLEVNPAFRRLTGLSPEGLIGRTILEVMPDTEPFWIETYGRVATTGESFQFEHFSRPLEKHFQITAYCPDRGQFATIFQDITESKRAEKVKTILSRILTQFHTDGGSRLYEVVLSTLLEMTGSSSGFFGSEDAKGNLVCRSMNREGSSGRGVCEDYVVMGGSEWKGVWGRSRSEKRTVISHDGLCLPETHVAIENAMVTPLFCADRLMGHLALANRPGGYSREDARMMDAVAEQVGPVLHARKQWREEQKNREKATEELRESEARFRTLVENAPDAIFVKTGGYFSYLNDCAVKVFGGSRAEDFFEKPVAHFFQEVSTGADAGQDSLGMASNCVQRGENVVLRPDGVQVPVEVSSVPIRFQGNESELVFVRDISERKRSEADRLKMERQIEQTQKLESLGVLAGGIAHDFNNILMAVLGHAELAMEELSPMSPVREGLRAIAAAARRAAELCRQMLAYAGKANFTLEKTDLRELINEMAHLLKTSISKKAILNLHLERGLPLVEVDQSQIRQIVLNLIINASEAIGDRSGVITVGVGATRCDEEYLRKTELNDDLIPGLYVHLEVTDTGCGMDAEMRRRIFEPFFTTKFAGRGLGLAAVMGIVRAHKGALKVYSEPGKGTTFKILFPTLEIIDRPSQPNGDECEEDWRGRGTILLVDDEESLLALGARMLERMGFTVLTAADGAEALERYRERQSEIDLVLLDLTMPHMDGAQAFGELRRINPAIRVVLASGYSEDDVAARFAGKGLDGVLPKPYTLNKLKELISTLLPCRPE
jgi:PAS domain S-box-containing protein